jgi:primary-amine oxidase
MTRRFVVATLVSLSGAGARAQTAVHPLDPLTGSEIQRAVAVLRQSNHLTDQARFGTITVQPRDKAASGSRGARIVGFDWSANAGFVAVVDLTGGRVESWTVVDSEPPMRLLSIRRAEEIAHADPRWIAAMRDRHVDTARVSILVGLPERAKLPRVGPDRVVNGSTYIRDAVPPGDIVAGLGLQLNLTKGRAESVSDAHMPIQKPEPAVGRMLDSPRAALKPLRIDQPAGSNVRVTGNQITWDRWSLRVGVDPRRGLEVHDVWFDDAGRKRSVLQSGSVTEIVAPYGDSSFSTWYPRDEGDYGMGIYSRSSAVVANDAPSNAIFLDATMHDHLGRPITVPRAIAVYERDGGILWRHANQSRRARQLVISGFSTIDNYDYQFNWIFNQDGAIEGEVVLSGIMNVSGGRAFDSTHAEGHSQTGHVVAPLVNAPNHQHFFSYRLDLDVDGTANTVYSMDSSPISADRNPRGELFAMSERPLATERAAASDVSFANARAWRVVNTHQRNALGQFTGYTLVPGAATPAFARPGSAPMRTAGFIAHQLWVTPYSPNEQYAAGEFQNLGLDNQGLPTWTAGDRRITDTDVVLWYTLGITHIPRPEDWPYMPAHRGSFRLVPTSFFSRDPVLDVPAAQSPERP